MEPAYAFARAVVAVFASVGGHKTIRVGPARIPPGPAVLAINHTSYVDFMFAAAEIRRTEKRIIRFMAKIELYKNVPLRLLMNGVKVIPVDRSMGHDSYLAAVMQLRAGELIGVFTEATISRSFEIKTLKTGAARMALEAGVPIIPVIVWGSQRIATKGQPKALGHTKTPVAVAIGSPLAPAGDAASLTAQLHEEMTSLLHVAQDAYGNHPPGAFWVPARLGGGAPTIKEADALDEAEHDEKERVRAAMRQKKRR